MNRRWIAATAVACALTTHPAAADLTLRSTSSGTGLGALGSGDSVTYIKGAKMRNDWEHKGKRFSTIFDLDAQQMISVNHQKKEAEIFDLAELRTQVARIQEGDMSVQVKPTGNTRSLLGRDCQEYRIAITVPASPEPDQPLDVVLSGPVWLAKDSPGAADYRGFYLAAAEKGFIANNPEAVKAQPGQAKAWAAMYREMAKAGVPYLTEISVGFEGSGMMAQMMSRMGGTTMTTTVTEVSTDPIPADTFAVPAGYKTKRK